MPAQRHSRQLRSSQAPPQSTENCQRRRVMTPTEAAVDAVARPAMAVLGAGSWGTALAVHLARTGHPTVLWGRDAAQMAAFAAARCNTRYLPMAQFPPTLAVETDLARAVASAQELLVAVPSHSFRECLEQVAPLLRHEMRVCWATKGFELDTGKLPHQVANEVLGIAVPKAVLSGPTFPREVGLGLPTAMTVASRDHD